MIYNVRFTGVAALFVMMVIVVSCIHGDPHQQYPKSPEDRRDESIGKIQGKDIVLWHSGGGGLLNPGPAVGEGAVAPGERSGAHVQQGVGSDVGNVKHEHGGVNRYLWQAALSCMAKMPISVIDKDSGMISTDWYYASYGQNERCKASAIFHGSELKSNGVEVNVFCEKKDTRTGEWLTASTQQQISDKMHEQIVNDASRLRYFDENEKKNR